MNNKEFKNSIIKDEIREFNRFEFKNGSKVTVVGIRKETDIELITYYIYYRHDYKTNIRIDTLSDFLNRCEKQLNADEDPYDIMLNGYYKKIEPEGDPIRVIGYNKNVIWLNDDFNDPFSISKKIFIKEYKLCASNWW